MPKSMVSARVYKFVQIWEELHDKSDCIIKF